MIDFIIDSNGNIEAIIVQFDNPSWGKRLRERKKGYAKKYEKQNGTPIFPFDHEYQLIGKKQSMVMLQEEDSYNFL